MGARDEIAARFARQAAVHEWLTVPGGSEKVLLAILELLPDADVYASIYDLARWSATLAPHRVHASWLNRVPGATTHYPRLLPLMDRAFRSFDLSEYDLVVSSNHACAKNVRVPDDAVHVCYCHTPMRYVWDPEFLAGERLGRVSRTAFDALLPMLRRADLRGAKGVDRFVANSTVVAERIRTIYGRESEVVHPPVDVARWLEVDRAVSDDAPYLVFGRVVPYKRADLAVLACERLGRPLVVAGDGRDLDRVRSLGGRRTTFAGAVDGPRLETLIAGARALLFPGIEDFGIVPVEAQAAGVPVIGNRQGGVRDSVVDGRTGVLYDGTTVDDLVAAIERFESLSFDEAEIRDNARRFAPERFADEFATVLARAQPGV